MKHTLWWCDWGSWSRWSWDDRSDNGLGLVDWDSLDWLALNWLAHDGLALNWLALDRLALNRLALDGLALDGLGLLWWGHNSGDGDWWESQGGGLGDGDLAWSVGDDSWLGAEGSELGVNLGLGLWLLSGVDRWGGLLLSCCWVNSWSGHLVFWSLVGGSWVSWWGRSVVRRRCWCVRGGGSASKAEGNDRGTHFD